MNHLLQLLCQMVDAVLVNAYHVNMPWVQNVVYAHYYTVSGSPPLFFF